MLLAKARIIAPKEWEHDPELKDNEEHTVCYYLWE